MHDYPCSDADIAMYAADKRNARLYTARQAAKAAADHRNARIARYAAIHTMQAAKAAYYTHQTPTGTVLLGDKAIADAQRAEDDAEGGLVARICGYQNA